MYFCTTMDYLCIIQRSAWQRGPRDSNINSRRALSSGVMTCATVGLKLGITISWSDCVFPITCRCKSLSLRNWCVRESLNVDVIRTHIGAMNYVVYFWTTHYSRVIYIWINWFLRSAGALDVHRLPVLRATFSNYSYNSSWFSVGIFYTQKSSRFSMQVCTVCCA